MYPINDMTNNTTTMTVHGPNQVPAISVEMQRMEKTLAELAETAAALESRLMVAMREPEPSQIRSDNPGVAPAQSQLAVMLHQRVLEAEGVAYRLSSILRRLEI